MSRLSSFILAAIVSLSLSYYLLSSYYAPLTNWLGPLFGSDMYFSLGILVMVLGNPFTYALVFVSWLIIGITIGLTSRRILRSISVTISVYFFLWGVAVGAIFSYFISYLPSLTTGTPSFSSLSSFTGIFSLTPPPGTNIASILFEPILYQMLTKLLSLNVAGGSPFGSLTSTFEGMLYGPIISFIICAGSAGVVSHFMKEMADSGKGKRGPSGSRRLSGAAIIFIAVMMVILLVAAPYSGISRDQQHVDEPTALLTPHLYNEYQSCNLVVEPSALNYSGVKDKNSVGIDLTLISHNGNLYNLCYLDSNASGIPLKNEYPNLISSYLILDSNVAFVSDLFGSALKSSGFGINLNSLLDLVPGGILVIYTSSKLPSPEKCANIVSQAYGNITGEPFFLLLNQTAFGVTIPSFLAQNGAQFIYLSGDQFTGGHSNLTEYVNSISSGGIAELMNNTITNRIKPINGFDPCSDTLVLGYSSNGSIPLLSTSNLNSTTIPVLHGASDFALNLHVRFNSLNSTVLPSADLQEITGYDRAFNFSCESPSYFEILSPEGGSSSYSNLSSDYHTKAFVLTNSTDANHSYNSNGVNVSTVGDTFYFEPSMSITINSTLPPPILVSSSISTGGGKITLSFTAKNGGNSIIRSVSLYDSYTEIVSPGSLSVKEVNITTSSSAVPPGSEISITIRENGSNPGIYAIPGPLLSFSYGNSTFYEIFSPSYVKIGKENVFSAVSQYYGYIIYSLASLVTKISLSTSILLAEVVTILLLVYAVYAQYRDLRKWLERRRGV